MANAKQCDRCKNFFLFGDAGVSCSGSFVDGIQFRSSGSSRSGIDDRDLCKNCIEDLKLFLDGASIDIDKKERDVPFTVVDLLKDYSKMVQSLEDKVGGNI